jgi:LSD1 subclass zinc finger protein
MGGGELIGLVVTLVVVLVSLVVTLVVTLVSIAVPVLLVWWIFKQVSSGKAQLVVASPLLAAGAGRPDAGLVLRSTCRSCGAARVTPSRSAYVYCDYCGLLMDFDFQAAIADKRSKLPGPAYEALVRGMAPRLEAARRAGDRDGYRALQVQIWDSYASACPAALSPRIGDPAYRKRFVAWQSDTQTAQDLDPACQASFAAQQAAVGGLQWDRSNPFQPKAVPESVWPMLDAVARHQANSLDVLDRDGLLDRHPDQPTREILRRMGVSTLAQGWLPFLARPAQDELIARLELGAEYTRVEPPPTRSGPCPSCGAPLAVVEGARRVVCEACGHLAGAASGSLRCHGCGTPVEIPEGVNLFACPSCQAELRMMRW